MYVNVKDLFLAGAACSLYFGAVSHPTDYNHSVLPRGRFGGGDPGGSVPGGIRSGSDAPAIPVTRPGGSNSGGPAAIAKDFQPPQSYTANIGGKGPAIEQGQTVQKRLRDAHGPDRNNRAVSEYDDLIANPLYKVDYEQTPKLEESLPSLKAPLRDLNIDPETEFRLGTIKAQNQFGLPVSTAYFSREKKTMIVAYLDNGRYGTDFEGRRAKQSQMAFRGWKVEVGDADADVRSLQYVIRNDINNDQTRNIITDIFGGFKINSKESFKFDAPDGGREKATFDALSGSDNGRGVFLMLADNFQAFGGKTVKKVTAYVDDDAWTCHLIWELTP